jgi:Mn-dependent DtxR family transcriptional regulator
VCRTLHKHEEGRFIEIAQKMGVEPPFVTELICKLEKQKWLKPWIILKISVKIVQLTEKVLKTKW